MLTSTIRFSYFKSYEVRIMVVNVTFNNISVIAFVSFIGGGNKSTRSATSHWQTLSHNVVSVVIGTDCTGSCKSTYHTITATTTPSYINICLTFSNLSKWHVPFFERKLVFFYLVWTNLFVMTVTQTYVWPNCRFVH